MGNTHGNSGIRLHGKNVHGNMKKARLHGENAHGKMKKARLHGENAHGMYDFMGKTPMEQ
jgi:hypothetical protein